MHFLSEAGTQDVPHPRWQALCEAAFKQARALVLAAIVVASLLFRLHVSRECSLWLDEVITHADVMKPWPEVFAGAERVHPPLSFVLVKIVFELFGGSETSLRAVSLVSGCVLLVATYWLCLELGFKATRALATVALLAITPFFVEHATEARQYALYPAFGTLALAATFRLLREPTRLRSLLVFALSASGMAATHYFGVAYSVALIASIVVGTLLRWKELALTRRRVLGRTLVLVGVLGVLAWVTMGALALARYYGRPGHGETTLPWPALLAAFIKEFALLGDVPLARVLQIVFAALGLVLLGRSLRGLACVVPAALAFGPCLAALFIHSGHFVAPRYLAPSWVLYHVGACAALFALGELLHLAFTRVPRLGALAVWAPLALPLVLRLVEYPEAYGAGTQYYRGLQRYFVEHLAADTRLVAYSGPFGQRIMGDEYKIGSAPIPLERFRKLPHVNRYLVAEFNAASASRQAELESLVQARLGVSPEVWRALPLVDLPESTYQSAVRARLIEFDGKLIAAPPDPPRQTHDPRRHHQRRTGRHDDSG